MYASISTPFSRWYLCLKLLLVLIVVRVKREKEKSRRKKNSGIDTIEIWFLTIATSPSWGVTGTSWGTRCLLRTAGGGFRPLKGLPGYLHVFLPHSLPFKHWITVCALRVLSTIGIPGLDLTRVSELTVEKIRLRKNV